MKPIRTKHPVPAARARSSGYRSLLASLLFGTLLAGHSTFVSAAAITVGNARGYPGQSATVPVAVRQATNIVAAQFELAYNPQKGVSGLFTLSARHSNHVVRSREIAPGVRRVVVYSPNNASLRTNGFAGSFTFAVPPDERVGSGAISPKNTILARRNGTAVTPVSAGSGAVFISPVFVDSTSGTVDLFFPSVVDQHYVVQATSDFVVWVNISTNLATSDFIDIVDHDAPLFPQRFYRTVLLDALGQISVVARAVNGDVTLQINGLNGRTYEIQASSNLVDWSNLGIRTVVGSSIQFTDSEAKNFRQRFYRLRSR